MYGKYSDEVKFRLVKRYLNGEGSYSSLAREQGISHVLLLTWVRKYRRGDFSHMEKLLEYEHQIQELQGTVRHLTEYAAGASVV